MTRPQGKSGFLTVNEVAMALRVSNMTVYRLLSDRALPYTAVGKTFRIKETDLKEYLRRSERR